MFWGKYKQTKREEDEVGGKVDEMQEWIIKHFEAPIQKLTHKCGSDLRKKNNLNKGMLGCGLST
jgi:hypothetical protein